MNIEDNSVILKRILLSDDYSRINEFALKDWTQENLNLFLDIYLNKKIFLIPESLLNSSYLLSLFIDKQLDCYEFLEQAWTPHNIDEFFKKEELFFIPSGLQTNNYALSKTISLKKYDLIVYFKKEAWTIQDIINYLTEVPEEDLNINEELLEDTTIIKILIEKGLIKNFTYELKFHKLIYDEAVLYIDYLKKTNDSTILFPKSSLLLKLIIKEKMYEYYSLFNDEAWDDECINDVVDDYVHIQESIPKVLTDNPKLLKQLLLNNSLIDYNTFTSSAWNEENISLFENILLISDYCYEIPMALKNSSELLTFILKNDMTNYLEFFYNGVWTKNNIELFIKKYIEEDNIVTIPFNLHNRAEVLKYVLLYNRTQYFDSFVEEAWDNNNITLLKVKISKGLNKSFIPSLLKRSLSFLGFVLSNHLTEYYDFFEPMIEIDKEADTYYSLFTNNNQLGLPKWFTSSTRGLHLILNNSRYHELIKLFTEQAWNEDNTKLYINFYLKDQKIVFYQSMYQSKKVLNVLVKYKEFINEFTKFDLNLWDENNILQLINTITEDNTIKNILVKIYEQMNSIALKRELLKYILDNHNNIDLIKLQNFAEIIVNIANSNSSEIHRLKDELVPLLLKSTTPLKDFKIIEDIFLSNHLPEIAKRYYVYQIFHKDGVDLSRNTISPILQNHKQYQDYIILSDLLKVAIESNNTSLRNYILRLQEGQRILNIILADNNKINKLSFEEKNIIDDYVKNIYLLYNSSRYSKSEKYELTNDILKDIYNLLALLKTDHNSLLDRIIAMYFGLIGIKNYDELIKKIMSIPELATLKGIKNSYQGLIIQKGDFIKGINDVKYLSKILDNGSLASEFLGASAKKEGDCTPLDTDCSIIPKNDSLSHIFLDYEIEANNYGNTWLVLKNNNRFTITRTEDESNYQESKYDRNKMEAFSTLGGGCFGIRTGFGSTQIDYIVTREYSDQMAFTITKNGFYIPVFNPNGELLFTKDDYYKIKSQMDGLSHYGEYNYIFSNNLDFPEMIQFIRDIPIIEKDTSNKKQLISTAISEALSRLGLEMKIDFDGDLSRNKYFFIDIGSTGRKTNLKNDTDFDFLLMLDKSITNDNEKMRIVTTAIRKALNKQRLDLEDRVVNGYDFRFTDVLLPGLPPLKIDITFADKNDTITYSSDMCIKDRFSTMNKASKNDTIKAIANIMFAKQLLKNNHVYKSRLSSTPEGGMSAIGIETWILSHGGSFIDAAIDFVNKYNEALEITEKKGYVSKETVWNNFKKIYKVWNFGENYYSLRKKLIPLHGEFIDNDMTEDGLYKMAQCLNEYLISHNLINDNNKKKD